jgi:hypothetical protein
MSDEFYVTTDATGTEHAASGRIEWVLPNDGVATDTNPGATLILRRADALLEDLDERIFRATSDEQKPPTADGTLEVTTARLVSETSWNAAAATKFAIACARHLLDVVGDIALPDGTSLTAVLDDAQNVLDGISSDAAERLDYLARVRALRRLKHARRDIAEQSLEALADDDVKDVDALDDPAYEKLAPITDAVLAAIEALRHHVYPHLYTRDQDAHEERLEHKVEDRTTPFSVPTIYGTAFGSFMAGGGPNIEYDPAWTSAREAARHARKAVEDLKGPTAEAEERKWQADALQQVLNS